ncbi:MAG: hypothetical protein KC486_23365 [Myxococcales bacterium]|nr:hypothetical protein [Myxococcales bacterium]
MSSTRIPFTREDKEKIASAATWGLVVSVTSLITGALALLVELSSAKASEVFGQMLQTGFTVVINIWLLQASLALRKVASDTNANDQGNLLIGFRKLRAYFMAQVIVILIAVALGVLAFVAMKAL